MVIMLVWIYCRCQFVSPLLAATLVSRCGGYPVVKRSVVTLALDRENEGGTAVRDAGGSVRGSVDNRRQTM